jgi:hypothetical protein
MSGQLILVFIAPAFRHMLGYSLTESKLNELGYQVSHLATIRNPKDVTILWDVLEHNIEQYDITSGKPLPDGKVVIIMHNGDGFESYKSSKPFPDYEFRSYSPNPPPDYEFDRAVP